MRAPVDHSLCSISRLHAALLLVTFVLAAALFVAVTLSPLATGFADVDNRGPGDMELYKAEVARMQAGETYYQAAENELTQRGYPTRSVFNWRTPLPTWLFATFPPLASRALLVGLGLALVGQGFGLLADESNHRTALLGALFLAGALLPCFLEQPAYSSELWSGMLLALSAVCLVRGHNGAGVSAGTAALFLRELAAPYVLLCAAAAAWGRRWRELAGWSCGLVGYAAFYGFHLAQVLPRIGTDSVAQEGGWVQFGGAAFLISTVQLNGILLLLPQWVAAIYLACALLGAATWNTPAGRLIGLTVALYVVAFSIVGYDYNQYWGSMTAPLLCLPAARAPGVLVQLWRVISTNTLAVSATS